MTKPKLSIAPATQKDRSAILVIVTAAIRAGDTYPYDPNSTPGQIEALWFAPSHRVYVATGPGEQVLGTFYIRPNQPGLGDHVCNAGFIVANSAAGGGIGTAMGEFSLSEAKRLGFSAMQFNLVVKSNKASLRIWDKLGFVTIGTIPAAFRHPRLGPTDADILHRPL
ncbi:MAG: GNAT family N-acetyltransferase [Alphaproteobacteria bacterium]|nr:GNAT family N-acetyltransferase [Alphaproteobacteria bacterium]